ncbi:MAG: N-acetyltransferase [Alphaproteobacteria bacterium]|nr:N-acetyltransferase [Alphaproteobacteria bacterium]
MYALKPERAEDGTAIDILLDHAFGANRHERTVYKLRLGTPLAGLSLVARKRGSLVGSLRFWPVELDRGADAVLLGPLAVDPSLRGQGIGKALVAKGLTEAARSGYGLCLVSGDPAYYRPFGFVAADPLGLALPGPVTPGHFQVKELMPGWLALARGTVRPATGRSERAA